MTLPAFAAEHRRACSMAPAVIDRYLLPAGRSAADPPAAVVAVDRWDRETDGRTDARALHKRCSAYYVGDASPHTMRPLSESHNVKLLN